MSRREDNVKRSSKRLTNKIYEIKNNYSEITTTAIAAIGTITQPVKGTLEDMKTLTSKIMQDTRKDLKKEFKDTKYTPNLTTVTTFEKGTTNNNIHTHYLTIADRHCIQDTRKIENVIRKNFTKHTGKDSKGYVQDSGLNQTTGVVLKREGTDPNDQSLFEGMVQYLSKTDTKEELTKSKKTFSVLGLSELKKAISAKRV